MLGLDAPGGLRGRDREREALDGLLASVRAGSSGALVIRGEAGGGKTALLDYTVQQASGCRIARVTGVESEMELAFAGLHQLCAPLLAGLPQLPAPQAQALTVALGLRDGDAPDRFLVGLAVLTLLSEGASERPLVCVVDDGQWLDRASGQVLAFVARRLAAESVVLLFGVREPSDEQELRGLPALSLPKLRDEDARALLASVVPGPLDARVRDRFVAEAHGNPLALLELPRDMNVHEIAGGFGFSRVLGVSGRIEESFLRRVQLLTPEARWLLMLAAAEPLGDPHLLWAAAEWLGIDMDAAKPVETDGLLTIGERVAFRHPLVRSTVYQSSTVPARRAVHRALAEVTDPDVDPDRRAWHLAAAASGLDEEVAGELERSAGRAQARGGLAAAAAFLQRAVALTPDPARRADRALAAAEANLQAGAVEPALGLLNTVEGARLQPLQRARVDLLRAMAVYTQSRGSSGPPLLLRAARSLEPLDPRLARETYLDAWSAALYAGPLARGGDLLEVSRQALATPPPSGRPRPCELLLEGFSLAVTDGRAAAAPVLARAAAGFDSAEVTVEEVLRWGWLATAAAVMVWDYDTCLAVTTRETQVARDSGALSVLVVAANVLAQAVALGGDLRQAASLVAEAEAVIDATGTQHGPYGALLLAGMRGGEDAVELIDSTVRAATDGGQGIAAQYAHWAAAIYDNGRGRYEEALAAARRASDDTPELFVSSWALSELIEAAARSEDVGAARDGLDRLTQATQAAGTDWALGMEARCRALVSDGGAADQLYREAIERLSRTRVRPEIARAHLLYGEWLRRQQRRVDARVHLHAAHDMLTTMRMDAFAERARRELAATGERVRRRTVETLDDLTPQEVEIARLAVAGHSNPAIGAQLFLSPRTVEWHLRKVFLKLGVASRKELVGALGEPGRIRVP
jgi:DNA-binding CsgD family transcriptional regulator/tetratricopeptide (TPR) repeat protein